MISYYGKYDQDGNGIGWHYCTTYRNGLKLDPPEIVYEKENING